MEIKAYGIALCPTDQIQFPQFWASLESHSKKQVEALADFIRDRVPTLPDVIADKQILAIDDYENNYKAGIVIKVRDAKSIFKVDGSGPSVKISAHSMGAKARQTEVNFFLFRKDNGKGLYAYYHQSSHMNDFCIKLKRVHESLLQEIRLSLQARRDANELTERQLKAERGKLQSFKYVLMTKPGDAADLIDGLKRLKSLNLVFEDWGAQTQGDMTPLVNEAHRTAVRMSFTEDSNLGAIQTAVRQLLSRPGKLKRLRAEGIDADELDQVISLTTNLKDFARTDYDGLAEKIDVDLSDIQNSWKTSSAFLWLKHAIEVDGNAVRFQ